MDLPIQIGTTGKRVVMLLLTACMMVLAGAALVSGGAPGIGGLMIAVGVLMVASALYRVLVRRVVMTIDTAGLRMPRQIRLIPWMQVAGVRSFVKSGLARFLIVRVADTKAIPGFAAAQASAGWGAPKVEPDEIALNLSGADVRVDELVEAVHRILAIADAPEDEVVDIRQDPVIQRIAGAKAVVTGPIRWLLILFGPIFGIFTLWALVAMSIEADLLVMIIVAASAMGVWLIGSLLTMILRTTTDRCPQCKVVARYYKAHAGRPLTCPACRQTWLAGKHRVR